MKWCWICQIYGESFSSWTLSSRCISNLIFELINLFGWESLNVSCSGMINSYASVPELESERMREGRWGPILFNLSTYLCRSPHTLSHQFSSDKKWLEMTICIPKVVCVWIFQLDFFIIIVFCLCRRPLFPTPLSTEGQNFTVLWAIFRVLKYNFGLPQTAQKLCFYYTVFSW